MFSFYSWHWRGGVGMIDSTALCPRGLHLHLDACAVFSLRHETVWIVDADRFDSNRVNEPPLTDWSVTWCECVFLASGGVSGGR